MNINKKQQGTLYATLRHPVSYWQLVRYLIPTTRTLFSVSDIGTKALKRISIQTNYVDSLDNKGLMIHRIESFC